MAANHASAEDADSTATCDKGGSSPSASSDAGSDEHIADILQEEMNENGEDMGEQAFVEIGMQAELLVERIMGGASQNNRSSESTTKQFQSAKQMLKRFMVMKSVQNVHPNIGTCFDDLNCKVFLNGSNSFNFLDQFASFLAEASALSL